MDLNPIRANPDQSLCFWFSYAFTPHQTNRVFYTNSKAGGACSAATDWPKLGPNWVIGRTIIPNTAVGQWPTQRPDLNLTEMRHLLINVGYFGKIMDFLIPMTVDAKIHHSSVFKQLLTSGVSGQKDSFLTFLSLSLREKPSPVHPQNAGAPSSKLSADLHCLDPTGPEQHQEGEADPQESDPQPQQMLTD